MKGSFAHTRIFLAILALGAISIGCFHFTPTAAPSIPPAPIVTPSAPSASTEEYPTQGWQTCAPEEQGMDSQKLAAMLDAIQQEHLALHSLLIIRGGCIVSETYFASYRADMKHELYSCTKSFIATLVGIAIDKGYIDSVRHPVMDLLGRQTFANQDASKQMMTLEDVLTMRTGLDWVESDATYRKLYVSRDWVGFVMDEPMAHKPGTVFNYCTGCSHLLSAIVQAKTGMNPRDWAQAALFEPLGISDLDWITDSTGIPNGGWGLQLVPRDMAKLGYLYLHNGVWDGKQIVSAEWVKAATQKHTDTGSNLGYGYQWWTYPALDAYTAQGLYGQTIFVIPRLNLIVVTTAATTDGHTSIFKLIEEYIVPAAKR
jgi:CubicO group peptidase (beta-lactamase class C family)